METIYLDTHVVVWLFSKELNKISKKALDLIEESELLISPMVVLELEFLHEIGRLNYDSDTIVSSLAKTINLKVCKSSFENIGYESLKHKPKSHYKAAIQQSKTEQIESSRMQTQ